MQGEVFERTQIPPAPSTTSTASHHHFEHDFLDPHVQPFSYYYHHYLINCLITWRMQLSVGKPSKPTELSAPRSLCLLQCVAHGNLIIIFITFTSSGTGFHQVTSLHFRDQGSASNNARDEPGSSKNQGLEGAQRFQKDPHLHQPRGAPHPMEEAPCFHPHIHTHYYVTLHIGKSITSLSTS